MHYKLDFCPFLEGMSAEPSRPSERDKYRDADSASCNTSGMYSRSSE